MIILASASPRRSAAAASDRRAAPGRARPHIEERHRAGEPVEQCVLRLAEPKARHVAVRARGGALPVLGADTVVVLDGQLLGKPRDREHGPGDARAALGPHP